MKNLTNTKSAFKVFALLASAIALILVAGFILNHNRLLSEGDSYPLRVELFTEKSDYKKSEYVLLSMKITNTSDFLLEEDNSGCPAGTEVFLDKTINITDVSKADACLSIRTSRPLEPGESVTTPLMQFDLGYVESGMHTLQAKVAYIDPNGYQHSRSNEVAITINPADQVYNCKDYDASVNTMCDQVMIRASVYKSPEENDKICKSLRDKHLLKYYPNPAFIKHLSTADCDQGSPAVFVFNTTPGEQSDYWESISRKANKDYHVCLSTEYSAQWLKNPTYSGGKINCFAKTLKLFN